MTTTWYGRWVVFPVPTSPEPDTYCRKHHIGWMPDFELGACEFCAKEAIEAMTEGLAAISEAT